jgi:hypothetical protein
MIFTIDIDNDIRAHESATQADEATKLVAGTIVVCSEKDMAKAAAEWPSSRLMELWKQLRRRCALHGLQAGQEVREPRQSMSHF